MHFFAPVLAMRTVDHQIKHGLLCVQGLKKAQDEAICIQIGFCTDDIVWWWVMDKA